LRHHALKEPLRDFAREQPPPIFGEDRDVPLRIVQVQADRPMEKDVLIELFPQHAFTAQPVHDDRQVPAGFADLDDKIIGMYARGAA
jgi:hypothetical protein